MKFRAKQELNPDLCDAGAVLRQLSYQANWSWSSHKRRNSTLIKTKKTIILSIFTDNKTESIYLFIAISNVVFLCTRFGHQLATKEKN